MSDPSTSVDNEVLRLRSAGRAFARISKDLGLGRGVDAQRAFHRAVRGLPEAERQRVSGEEVLRLDRLAERVRADITKTDMDRARQLRTIDRMRSQILEDA
jgi:hypothetical protein